jgi:hypothetical protein
MLRKRSWLPLATSLFLSVGCAGGAYTKIEKSAELPKELSADVKEKFEVRDLSQLKVAQNQNDKTDQNTALAKPLSLATQNASVTKVEQITGAQSAAKPDDAQAPEAKSKHSKKKKHDKAKDKHVAATPAPASVPAFAYPSRRPAKDPIWVGEKLTYQVTYLGIPAGTFTLEALPYKAVGDRKVYHIMAKAWNSAVFGLMYKLEDYVETYIDYDGFFSHRFHLHQDETKQVRDSQELYDSEKKQSYWWNRWDRKERGYSENKDFYPMEPFPQDTLSSLYYLRAVPLPPHGMVSFPVMSEGKPLTAYVTVMGREELDTAAGTLKTVKLKPEAATRGVLERKGDSYMWLTDDDRRFLVKIEAKVKIGYVVVELKKIELGTAP